MPVIIHMFYVYECKIDVFHNLQKSFLRHISRSFDGSMNLNPMTMPQHLIKKLGLAEGFSPTESDTSVASPIVEVALQDFHQFADGVILATYSQCLGRTGRRALVRAAFPTDIPPYFDSLSGKVKACIGASVHTGTATR